jgi:hypothetical protein
VPGVQNSEALVVSASPSGGYCLGPQLARFAGQEQRLAGMDLRRVERHTQRQRARTLLIFMRPAWQRLVTT